MLSMNAVQYRPYSVPKSLWRNLKEEGVCVCHNSSGEPIHGTERSLQHCGILYNFARILYLYHLMFTIKDSCNYRGGV